MSRYLTRAIEVECKHADCGALAGEPCRPKLVAGPSGFHQVRITAATAATRLANAELRRP